MGIKYKEKPLRVYCSHLIRGPEGDAASPETCNKNRVVAHNTAEHLRMFLHDWSVYNGYPKVELYVPGEHDETIQLALDLGYMNIEEVLDIDCKILDRCNLLLVFGKTVSKGMAVEINYAAKVGIPVFAFTRLTGKVISSLQNTLYGVAGLESIENL